MNHIAKIALLIFSAVGTASAGSFTLDTLPPAALAQLHAPPAVSAYLKVVDIHASAAGHNFDNEGYIGTLQLKDVPTFDLSNGLTEVAVPEPATLVLVGSGLAVAALRRRRRGASA